MHQELVSVAIPSEECYMIMGLIFSGMKLWAFEVHEL
jgi:hypothetical protein